MNACYGPWLKRMEFALWDGGICVDLQNFGATVIIRQNNGRLGVHSNGVGLP